MIMTNWRISQRRAVKAVAVITASVFFLLTLSGSISYESCPLTQFHLTLPESDLNRHSDTSDTFSNYKNRAKCPISSLSLHNPFSPLCPSRSTLLTAMSSGGRIGLEAPYMPRSCDMRWFTTSEICEVLGRFDKVILVGDSMLRHVIGALNILLREDLGYGAVTDWNFNEEEKKNCFCNGQFDVKDCSVQGIYKTSDVLNHDPKSFTCKNKVDVIIESIVSYPIPKHELTSLKSHLPPPYAKKKLAFIFGHGLWSDLSHSKSLQWLDAVLESTPGPYPRLFVTPNAAGKAKPDEWLVSQGNKALRVFEESMGIEAAKRNVEILGTWNMSIQGDVRDGVHLGIGGNLVKAMMVLNWLNML